MDFGGRGGLPKPGEKIDEQKLMAEVRRRSPLGAAAFSSTGRQSRWAWRPSCDLALHSLSRTRAQVQTTMRAQLIQEFYQVRTNARALRPSWPGGECGDCGRVEPHRAPHGAPAPLCSVLADSA